MEEYAREVFPLEEAANGLKWMEEDVDGESSSRGGAFGNENGSDLGVGFNDKAEIEQGDGREGKPVSGTTGSGITTSSLFGGSC